MHLDDKDFLSRYAYLVTRRGLNLQKGQKLYIITTVTHYDFVRVVAQKAYRMGVVYVHIEVVDKHLLKARLEQDDAKDYTYYPTFLQTMLEQMVEEKWSVLRVGDSDELQVLEQVDKRKLSESLTEKRKMDKVRLRAASNDVMPWCIIEYPSPSWAKVVIKGELSVGEKLKKLKEIVARVMRLDTKDPIQAWDEHLGILEERAQKLNEWGLKTLKIQGSNVDLTVGLPWGAIWKSGASISQDGIPFVANMPTEEVFTTPNFRLTQGWVKTVRPVTLFGVVIQEIEFFFKEGKVIRFNSSSDEVLVQRFLDTDEGSLSLGEIAFVDVGSPLYRENLDFSSILYDENASCHFALGNAYPTCIKGGDKLSLEELLQQGINVSLNHTDFMFGAPDTSVKALSFDGKEYQILQEGRFILKARL